MATKRMISLRQEKVGVAGVLLDSSYNMPREEKQLSKIEEKAIDDIRQLLCFVEKQVHGTVSEKDQKEAAAKSKQWAESISILKKFLNTK